MSVIERVDRLNRASLRKVIEPDAEVAGEPGPGRVLPDELMSVHGLDLGLSEEQLVTLSREEAAATYEFGLRIEAALIAGFAVHVATSRVTDPATVYRLHEMGEETRHSRLFVRVIDSLKPQRRHRIVESAIVRRLAGFGLGFGMQVPATFDVMVLAGEEIPDLFQRRMIEHPDTDPFLKAVSRYHRQEESRHISFARLLLPDLFRQTGPTDRFIVRHLAPFSVGRLFSTFVHPWVYSVVGLPPIRTWLEVRRAPNRMQLRRECTRPVLNALLEAGALHRGRIPLGWRRLCGVDRRGEPVAALN